MKTRFNSQRRHVIPIGGTAGLLMDKSRWFPGHPMYRGMLSRARSLANVDIGTIVYLLFGRLSTITLTIPNPAFVPNGTIEEPFLMIFKRRRRGRSWFPRFQPWDEKTNPDQTPSPQFHQHLNLYRGVPGKIRRRMPGIKNQIPHTSALLSTGIINRRSKETESGNGSIQKSANETSPI